MYRLGYSSFERSMSRLSWSLLFTRAFLNSQSSGRDVMLQISKYWSIGIVTSSLEPRLSVPDFVLRLWRKIGEKIQNGEPGFKATIVPRPSPSDNVR